MTAENEALRSPLRPGEAPASDDKRREPATAPGQPGERTSPVPGGEGLGRFVHQVRLNFNAEQDRPFGLEPWDRRHASQRELDIRIGEGVAAVTRAAVRGQIARVLREHYLTGITCDHEREMDNPVCACSRVFLGWHESVGAAREAWITHVMDVASSEEEVGRG